MKEKIKESTVKIISLLIRVLRTFLSKDLVVIIPPYDGGSLGDEAMLLAITDSVKEVNKDTKFKLVTYASNHHGYNCLNANPIDMSLYFSWLSTKQQIVFCFTLLRCKQIYLMGADVLDGFYNENRSLRRIKLIGLAHSCGVPSSILGFSFKKTAKQSCIEALIKLPKETKVFTRDPESYKRLMNFGVSQAVPVTDLAFLLKPDQSNDKDILETIDWCRKTTDEALTVGINLNFTMLLQRIEDQDEVLQLFIDFVANSLNLNPKLRFLFIPHDNRSTPNFLSDWDVAKIIQNRLPTNLLSRFKYCPETFNARKIKRVVNEVDLVFTGRMHLAIATMGQGKAVVGLDYQDKFVGMFEHVGISHCVHDALMIKKTDELVSILDNSIKNHVVIENTVKANVNKLFALSKSQLDT